MMARKLLWFIWTSTSCTSIGWFGWKDWNYTKNCFCEKNYINISIFSRSVNSIYYLHIWYFYLKWMHSYLQVFKMKSMIWRNNFPTSALKLLKNQPMLNHHSVKISDWKVRSIFTDNVNKVDNTDFSKI